MSSTPPHTRACAHTHTGTHTHTQPHTIHNNQAAHSPPCLQWPEILREFAVAATVGPPKIKRQRPRRAQKPKLGREGEDLGGCCACTCVVVMWV